MTAGITGVTDGRRAETGIGGMSGETELRKGGAGTAGAQRGVVDMA